MVLLAFSPSPINAFATLLGITNIYIILQFLHFVLLFPNDKADPIWVFCKYFPDSLISPGQCKDERFFINPLVHH